MDMVRRITEDRMEEALKHIQLRRRAVLAMFRQEQLPIRCRNCLKKTLQTNIVPLPAFILRSILSPSFVVPSEPSHSWDMSQSSSLQKATKIPAWERSGGLTTRTLYGQVNMSR